MLIQMKTMLYWMEACENIYPCYSWEKDNGYSGCNISYQVAWKKAP